MSNLLKNTLITFADLILGVESTDVVPDVSSSSSSSSATASSSSSFFSSFLLKTPDDGGLPKQLQLLVPDALLDFSSMTANSQSSASTIYCLDAYLEMISAGSKVLEKKQAQAVSALRRESAPPLEYYDADETGCSRADIVLDFSARFNKQLAEQVQEDMAQGRHRRVVVEEEVDCEEGLKENESQNEGKDLIEVLQWPEFRLADYSVVTEQRAALQNVESYILEYAERTLLPYYEQLLLAPTNCWKEDNRVENAAEEEGPNTSPELGPDEQRELMGLLSPVHKLQRFPDFFVRLEEAQRLLPRWLEAARLQLKDYTDHCSQFLLPDAWTVDDLSDFIDRALHVVVLALAEQKEFFFDNAARSLEGLKEDDRHGSRRIALEQDVLRIRTQRDFLARCAAAESVAALVTLVREGGRKRTGEGEGEGGEGGGRRGALDDGSASKSGVDNEGDGTKLIRRLGFADACMIWTRSLNRSKRTSRPLPSRQRKQRAQESSAASVSPSETAEGGVRGADSESQSQRSRSQRGGVPTPSSRSKRGSGILANDQASTHGNDDDDDDGKAGDNGSELLSGGAAHASSASQAQQDHRSPRKRVRRAEERPRGLSLADMVSPSSSRSGRCGAKSGQRHSERTPPDDDDNDDNEDSDERSCLSTDV